MTTTHYTHYQKSYTRIHPKLGARVRRHAELERELARLERQVPRSEGAAIDRDRQRCQMYDELHAIERDSNQLWHEGVL